MRKNTAASQKTTARRKPRFAPVTLSEQEGVRYLHFGTEWIQGSMLVDAPTVLVHEYIQRMISSKCSISNICTVCPTCLKRGRVCKWKLVTMPGNDGPAPRAA